MQRSTDRILTTHVGSLPRPDDLRQALVARDDGQPYDAAGFESLVKNAVAGVVREQVAYGIDVINDGEQSKRSWSTYARERLAGHENHPDQAKGGGHPIFGRDLPEFAEYFETMGPGRGPNARGGITASGDPVGWRPRPSKGPQAGWTPIAASGRAASTASTST